jgi:superfamily II DNA/RNA helicase
MSFNELHFHPNILKAIIACKYTKPTPAQQRAIPLILDGKDIIVSAPTGTGKTAAFVLPILQHLTQKAAHQKARVLILAPTRELATQIANVISKYAKFMSVNVVNLIGGMSYTQQKRKLSQRVDIIVATPGRLMDYMDNHKLDLSQIEILVLDEADRMLDMGFIGDVKKIVAVTKKTRQTLLFSATADDKLISILQHLLKNPIRIDLTSKENTAELIKQQLYFANNSEHKKRILLHFLNNENVFKAIVFTATKSKATSLAEQLQKLGHSAAALHGDLKQNARNTILAKLRESKIQYLIATDVAARGIDIYDITHIINFDLPRTAEDYVHRIGRTGRAGKTGIAITLSLPEEGRNIQQIEKFLGQKIERTTIAGLEPDEYQYPKPARSHTKKNTKNTKYNSNKNTFKKNGPKRSDPKTKLYKGAKKSKSYTQNLHRKQSKKKPLS